MELDKRITKIAIIYDCFDCKDARALIGEKGYFSHYYHCFSDLNECRFGVLQDVIDSEHPYDNGKNQYDFFLPDRYINNSEKQYRPYTLNEFLDKYTVCANIRIRQRDRTCQYFGKLIGYQFPTDPNTGKQKGDNDAIVCIGGYNFKLTELFTDYEQYDNMKDIWVPCGVEVEE